MIPESFFPENHPDAGRVPALIPIEILDTSNRMQTASELV
jgi:hypothetical protein